MGTVKQGELVMLHEEVDKLLALLLLDVFVPYAEMVCLAALSLGARECRFVVSNAAVQETRQAVFLEVVVLPDCSSYCLVSR